MLFWQISLVLIAYTLCIIESTVVPCTEYKSHVRNVYQTSKSVYYSSCGFWGYSRCSHYRIKTQLVKVYSSQLGCCSGYGGSNCTPICNSTCTTNMECTSPNTCTCIEGWGGADCLSAICSTPCSENMECTSPNTCTCIKGWERKNCLSDIDECLLGMHSCDQDCSNTNGSYSCSCRRNFVLANDGLRCLGGVQGLHLNSDKRSIALFWLPPSNFIEDGALIKYHVTCHARRTADRVNENMVPFPTASLEFTSLTPYTNYTCCVMPYWDNNGTGQQTCVEGATREDAPEGPPTDIMLIPADSTSLLIQWMPPAVPNGIIKNYNLVINYSNSTNLTTRSVDSGSTLYLLSNLNVYQLVGISISATTGGGEGPMSSYVFNRSGETEPDQVHYLMIQITSNYSANVTWNPPNLLKGIVIKYHVILRNLTLKHSDSIMNTWILGSSDLYLHIQGLYPYIPYEVDVAAATQIGRGDIITKFFFTEESVPVIAPRWSTAMRTSATQIEMEWEPLSPMESRGFLKGYKVTYAPSILGCTVTDQVVSVFTVENKLVLNGLAPQKEYCVSLSAFTVKGSGIASNKTLIQVYEKEELFIFIGGILDCPIWRQQRPQVKIDDLSNEIVTAIYESCQCPVTPEYIYNSHFLPCVDEIAVVQLSIIGLINYKSFTLVEIVERWANMSPPVILEGSSVHVIKACKMLNCSMLTFNSLSSNKNSYVIGISMYITSVSFSCIAGITLFACLLFVKMKKMKTSGSPERSSKDENLNVSRMTFESENEYHEKTNNSNSYNIYEQLDHSKN